MDCAAEARAGGCRSPGHGSAAFSSRGPGAAGLVRRASQQIWRCSVRFGSVRFSSVVPPGGRARPAAGVGHRASSARRRTHDAAGNGRRPSGGQSWTVRHEARL